MVSGALKALHEFEHDLKVALVAKEWQSVAHLDARCRGLVAQAIDEMALTPSAEPTSTQRQTYQTLQRLADLYRQLQEQCVASRDGLAQELRVSQHGRSASKAYVGVQG